MAPFSVRNFNNVPFRSSPFIRQCYHDRHGSAAYRPDYFLGETVVRQGA
jgi:hypothetical protein